jgi:hypothetical protein
VQGGHRPGHEHGGGRQRITLPHLGQGADEGIESGATRAGQRDDGHGWRHGSQHP